MTLAEQLSQRGDAILRDPENFDYWDNMSGFEGAEDMLNTLIVIASQLEREIYHAEENA